VRDSTAEDISDRTSSIPIFGFHGDHPPQTAKPEESEPDRIRRRLREDLSGNLLLKCAVAHRSIAPTMTYVNFRKNYFTPIREEMARGGAVAQPVQPASTIPLAEVVLSELERVAAFNAGFANCYLQFASRGVTAPVPPMTYRETGLGLRELTLKEV
jgi:hypothetical protein